jgi:hypothetical protein
MAAIPKTTTVPASIIPTPTGSRVGGLKEVAAGIWLPSDDNPIHC